MFNLVFSFLHRIFPWKLKQLYKSLVSIIWFFYGQIKTNRTIASSRKCYCLCSLNLSLRLQSPLVFTATAFEISLFKGSERQYRSFWKIQLRKTLQGLASHHQNPQLNYSLALLFRLRSLRSRNRKPFSNSHFADCYKNFVTF